MTACPMHDGCTWPCPIAERVIAEVKAGALAVRRTNGMGMPEMRDGRAAGRAKHRGGEVFIQPRRQWIARRGE